MQRNAMQCGAGATKRRGGEEIGPRQISVLDGCDGQSQTRRAALSLPPSLHSVDRNPWPIQRAKPPPPGHVLHAAEKTIVAEDIEMQVWAVRRRLLVRRQQVNDRVVRRSVLHA